MRLLVIGLVMVAGTAAAQPKSPPPSVRCEFLEITATKGAEAAVDPALDRLKKKFKRPPFSSWNQFKLQKKEERVLTHKKAETIELKLGKAQATLLGIVNSTQVRLTITMDDASGKNFVNNTSTFAAADYLVIGHPLPNEDGHLLALTCK